MEPTLFQVIMFHCGAIWIFLIHVSNFLSWMWQIFKFPSQISFLLGALMATDFQLSELLQNFQPGLAQIRDRNRYFRQLRRQTSREIKSVPAFFV